MIKYVTWISTKIKQHVSLVCQADIEQAIRAVHKDLLSTIQV